MTCFSGILPDGFSVAAVSRAVQPLHQAMHCIAIDAVMLPLGWKQLQPFVAQLLFSRWRHRLREMQLHVALPRLLLDICAQLP